MSSSIGQNIARFSFSNLRNMFRPSSTLAGWVLIAQAYFFFSFALVYTLHFPRVLLYVDDVLNCILFIFALYEKRKVSQYCGPIITIMVLYCVFGAIGAVLTGEKLLILAWGYRNVVRYFIYFYTCVVCLKKSDIFVVLRVVQIIFWISLPLCIYERFMVTYSAATIIGDMVGGLFWNFSGSNLPLNLVLCLTLIYVSNKYFSGESGILSFILTLSAAIFMSAAAELKVFIFEIVIILLGCMFGNKISLKNFLIVVIGAAALMFSSSYFVALNARGSGYADNYTLQGYIDYATRTTGYDGVGDLNRFGGIGVISDTIFHNDPLKLLFGIGLGNADYTSFFTSQFYSIYAWMHYQWFHSVWIFIENGYVGVILYLAIIFVTWLHAGRYIEKGSLRTLIRVIDIVAFVMFFYNITLRVEPSAYLYMMFFAVPYIVALDNESIYKYQVKD